MLFLGTSGELGGAERGLVNLARATSLAGWQPLVLLPASGVAARALEAAGAEVGVERYPRALATLGTASGALARLGALPAAASYLRALRGWIRDLRPRLVWSNGRKMHLLGGWAARLEGRPHVAHLRDVESSGVLAASLRATATRVVANSAAAAAALELGPGTPLDVLPNAVDLRALREGAPRRAAARRQLGVPPEAFGVLAVGALCEHKGQARLLRAFAQAAASRPALRLWLVGGEPYRTGAGRGEGQRLDALAAELGVADRVRRVGEVRDPWPWYAAADVFALPSRSEGFGRAYLEAAALGLPVLATRVGGPPELFRPGEAQLLDPEDLQSWQASLAILADEPGERARLARAGRRAAARHDVASLERGVREILESTRGGR